MNNTLKFYFKNRFISVMAFWVLVCVSSFFGNEYINIAIISFSLVAVLYSVLYINDNCKHNAQERLFLKRLDKCLDFSK